MNFPDTEEVYYNEHDIFIGNFFNVGMNHTVIFDAPNEESSITINLGNHHYNIPTTDLKQNLQTQIPGYIWIVNNSFEAHEQTIPTRVIGIRRKYGMEGNDIISFVGNVSELLISYRFHPVMHKLKIINDWEIQQGDFIYMVPKLGHSKNISVTNWKFENQTTGQVFDSHLSTLDETRQKTNEHPGGTRNWFMALQEPIQLKPGYYNIKLQYLKGNAPQEYVVKSAFLMKK